MEKPPKRRTSISPSAAALASAAATASSCSSSASTNPAETASPSPYFLPELIPLVASRLTTLQDFFALRAACRTYRALLPPSPANLASQGPLLLLPHNASASEALYHATLRRLLRFRLPRAQPDSRHPSLTPFHSFGSRVAIQDIDASRWELRIRDLLTGEPASRLPDPTKDFEEVIFSGDLVLTFKRFRRAIHYCRIGDAHWRAAMCHEDYFFGSLMFVKGTLYGLVCPYFPRLAIVELHDNMVEFSFLGDESSRETVPKSSRFWLAECRGELLLVVDVAEDGPLFSPSVYHVYRWQSGERKWARTTSLGGCSLFFSGRQFTGCLGPDHPGVRRDCLYFTSWVGRWSEYSLVDESLREHVADYPGRVEMEDYGPLAWVLPSIG